MTNSLRMKLRMLRSRAGLKQHKLSAIILYKGRPISSGFNSYKTNPKISKYHKHRTTHAEMSALFKTKNKELLKNATIIVYREDRFGNMKIARPCSTCMKMLKDYGLKTVIYSTDLDWKEETL